MLAEVEREKNAVFEIIDGMQRLNAITSFIEGEFDYEDKFFDLATMVESKSRLDQEILVQQTPILERKFCEVIASYVLPLSVYSFDDEEKIDEVFRRINSNGKYLSRQELRASGATAYYPDLVRKISSEIRTDTSASDILLLNDMKTISITNKQLEYGIKVDNIFWIKNNILTKEMVRESKDEEIVADIVAYMALYPEVPRSSSDVLDEFYGLKESSKQEEIERSLQKVNSDTIRKRFVKVYDQIRKVLQESGCKFSELIFEQQNIQSLPRYFQVIFLSFYELMFVDNMEFINSPELITKLTNIGEYINIPTGGNWSATSKTKNISAVKGIIRNTFKLREKIAPATDSWLTEFERLLTQSKIEQTLYDFKQGFTKLDGRGDFDQDSFDKIIKTLTAMANHSPKAMGYVCVGVADTEATAKRVENLYRIPSREYRNFWITGIEHESVRLQGNLDNFFRWLIQQVQSQPIEQSVKDRIGKSIRLINYYQKAVVIFSIQGGSNPVTYDNRFYQRIGANVEEVKTAGLQELFRNFL